MQIFIDDANLENIKTMFELFPCDGVTTNPSILSKAGEPPIEHLKNIRKLIPSEAMLHAQVISQTAEEMVKEAEYMLKSVSSELFIKVPVTPEGIKAIPMMTKKGMQVTATAVYSAMQGFVAAKAGARYIAPYVNRLDNLCYDGLQVAMDIHDMLQMHNLNSDVVGASFKNSQQIFELCLYGIGAVTAPPEVLKGLIANRITESAVADFTADFEKLGGKTMLDF